MTHEQLTYLLLGAVGTLELSVLTFIAGGLAGLGMALARIAPVRGGARGGGRVDPGRPGHAAAGADGFVLLRPEHHRHRLGACAGGSGTGDDDLFERFPRRDLARLHPVGAQEPMGSGRMHRPHALAAHDQGGAAAGAAHRNAADGRLHGADHQEHLDRVAGHRFCRAVVQRQGVEQLDLPALPLFRLSPPSCISPCAIRSRAGAARWKGNSMQAVVELDQVHKKFGALHVLRGVSFSVTKGQVVAIIGKSRASPSIESGAAWPRGGHGPHQSVPANATARRSCSVGGAERARDALCSASEFYVAAV